MDLPARLDRDGVCIEQGLIGAAVLDMLRPQFATAAGRPGARGFRVTIDVADLVGSAGTLCAVATRATGKDMRPVRVLFFDKTPEANWAIPWHQDRTIAVKTKSDVDGFGPWTVKDGVAHVEPPVKLLEAMLSLRLFVDDCDESNGPLQVAIGSHRRGRLPVASIADVVSQSEVRVCTGRAGDVLLMKALAVHSSKASAKPGHRRVLHVDYAPEELPSPLEWHFGLASEVI